jgi:hypothetical protein
LDSKLEEARESRVTANRNTDGYIATRNKPRAQPEKLPLTVEKGDSSCENSTKIGMVTNFERVTHGQLFQIATLVLIVLSTLEFCRWLFKP